jgi:hypothetical protein
MALQPVLSLINLAEDASVIKVIDTTGVYNATTNAGGYGTPNPASNAIVQAFIIYTNFKDLTKPYRYKLLTPASLFTGVELKLSLFTGSLEPFPDGVINIDANITFASSQTGSRDATDKKKLNITNANTVLDNVKGVIFPSVSSSGVYYLDKTKTITSSAAFTLQDLPDVTSSAMELVYESTLKVHNDKAGYKSLNIDIAAACVTSDCCCDCLEPEYKDIWKRLTWFKAAKIKFNAGFFTDANELLQKLIKY